MPEDRFLVTICRPDGRYHLVHPNFNHVYAFTSVDAAAEVARDAQASINSKGDDIAVAVTTVKFRYTVRGALRSIAGNAEPQPYLPASYPDEEGLMRDIFNSDGYMGADTYKIDRWLQSPLDNLYYFIDTLDRAYIKQEIRKM
jgi:hypothetical protein